VISCAILSKLLQDTRYVHFFEACRLLRGMPRLNLESFLLTPVQRICRYSIQLRELLKATPSSHSDRLNLEQALVTMKGIANRADRRMNRLEHIENVIKFQKSVQGFRGPNLIENNCRLLHSGEVSGRCFARSSLQWTKNVHLFLFDQSAIICKKIVRKNECVFKERFSLNAIRIVDFMDGKDSTGTILKHTFQIDTQNRSYLFSCKDVGTKSDWMQRLRSRPSANPPTVDELRVALLALKYR